MLSLAIIGKYQEKYSFLVIKKRINLLKRGILAQHLSYIGNAILYNGLQTQHSISVGYHLTFTVPVRHVNVFSNLNRKVRILLPTL